jgi:hypothetical protein
MEGPLMLMNQQNAYCKNDYATKSNLYVQCNPHQISNNILHRKEKSILICTQQRLQITEAILSKKSNAGGITIPYFKLYYRSIKQQ